MRAELAWVKRGAKVLVSRSSDSSAVTAHTIMSVGKRDVITDKGMKFNLNHATADGVLTYTPTGLSFATTTFGYCPDSEPGRVAVARHNTAARVKHVEQLVKQLRNDVAALSTGTSRPEQTVTATVDQLIDAVNNARNAISTFYALNNQGENH